MEDLSNISTMVQQAEDLVAAGQWEEAKGLYEQALELQPDNLEVREKILKAASSVGDYNLVIVQNMNLAELAVKRGDPQDAQFRYTEIINLEKTVAAGASDGTQAEHVQMMVAQVKPEIFAKLGIIELSAGHYQDAIGWLKPSIDLEPGRWDTHLAMGRALMESDRHKEAIGEFQEVVRLSPSDAAQAYEMLGEIFLRGDRPPHTTVVWFRNAGELYVQRNELSDAMRVYERILEFEPENKDILLRLADIYQKENLSDKAAQVFNRLAEIYQAEGLMDKVISYLEKLLACEPDNREARSHLADCFRQLVHQDPSNVSMRMRLIDNLLYLGEYGEAGEHQLLLARSYMDKAALDDAMRLVRRLLEFEPDNLEARMVLADIYRRKGMNGESLAEYQEVVRLCREAGHNDEAMDLQRKLVTLFPETADLRYQVALSLRSQGDRQGAAAELVRLVGERPNDIIALNYLSEEYAALDDWAKAVDVYRTILNIEPGRSDVRKRLVRYFLSIENIEEAVQELEQLPQDDYERTGFMHAIVSKYIETDNLTQAEGFIDRLADFDEHKVIFRKEIIKRYLEKGELQKADAALPGIPRSDKERNRLVTGLMERYLSSSQLEAAAGLVDRLPFDDSLRLSFQRRLISSYQDCGRFEDAMAEMGKLPAGDEYRADFISRQITGLMAAGRIDDAVNEIRRIPISNPARNSFVGQLIEAYLQAGETERAAEEISSLDDDEELASRYRRRLIQAYLNSDQLERAEIDIFALASSDPEKRSFLRLLLQKYEACGNIDKVRWVAMQLPDDMLEKKHYLDGIVHSYLSSGNIGAARQEVYSMAEQFSKSGDHAEAVRYYSDLLSYHPVDVDIRLRLCRELAMLGQLERARENMLALAGRFQREGNATSVADIYSRMLEFDPDNLNARFRLGEIWADHGQTSQALEQFSFLANVYLKQNLPEVAQRVLNRILALDPKDIPHRRQLIKLLTRNLRFDEATEHHRVLLGIHLDRGEQEEAQACVREIVTLQPLNLELRLHLGEMFLKAGFLEEGQNQMESLASTYKGRGDHSNVVRVYGILVEAFNSNQQWETALEYVDRIADEYVEADNWSGAQEQYLFALEQYLFKGRKDSTDPIFVKLIDGFFRHKVVDAGVDKLRVIGDRLKEAGLVEAQLVVRDRLAGIMERQSKWDEALDIVEAISASYKDMGEFDHCISYCRRAADLALGHDKLAHGIELLTELAALNLDYRNLESATSVFGELRKRTEGATDSLFTIAEMLFAHNYLEEARPYFLEVLDVDHSRTDALSRVAIIYARQGKLVEAADLACQIISKGLTSRIVEEYSKSLGCSPNDAAYHIKMGDFYRQMGFMEEAVVEYAKANNDPAKVMESSICLADVFEHMGYRNLAIKQLQKALGTPGFTDKELLDLRYHMASIMEQAELYGEALQAYQECYAVDIEYRDVAQKLETLFAKVDPGANDGSVADIFDESDDDIFADDGFDDDFSF